MKRSCKKNIALFFKWLIRVVAGVFFLVILLLLLLQFPLVQTHLAGHIAREISSRTGAGFSVERIGIRLPGAINLHGVYVEDHQADTLLYAGSLHIDMQIFSLFRNQIVVNRLHLSGVTVNLIRQEPDTLFNYELLIRALSEPQPANDILPPGAGNKNDKDSRPWIVDVGDIRLKQIRFHYADHFNGTDIRIHLDGLSARVDTLDIFQNIGLDHLMINNMAFGYRDQGDFSLQLEDMDLQLHNVLFSADTLIADLQHFSGRDVSGFSLKRLSAKIALGRVNSIRDICLESRESMLEGDLVTSMPVLQAGDLFAPHHTMDVDIRKARIGRDLSVLFPDLHLLFPDSHAPGIDIQAKAGGTMHDLQIDSFSLEIPGRFLIGVAGGVSGLPHLDSLSLDIPGIHFSGGPGYLMTYAGVTVPDDLFLPETLTLQGSFNGLPDDFQTGVQLDAGYMKLLGSFHFRQQSDEVPVWAGDLTVAGENPLLFIDMDSLINDLHASFTARGRGFDPATMDLIFEGKVDSVRFNQYTYRSLDMHATARDGIVRLVAGYHDDHMSVDANNVLNISGKYPELLLDWTLAHLNAKALNLSEDLIAVQSRLMAEMKLEDPQLPDGWVHLFDTHVLVDREVFSLDSLKIVTAAKPELYTAKVSSPILWGNYRGNFPPMGIPDALFGYLRGYTEAGNEEGNTGLENKVFELTAMIHPSPYFSEILFPFIDSFEPFTLDVSFNSEDRILSLDADIPDIKLLGFHMQHMQVHTDPAPSGMDFSVHLSGLDWGQVMLKNVRANGVFGTGKLDFDVSFDDRHNTSWLGVSGQMRFFEDYTELHLDRDILVNRQEWRTDPVHFLRVYADNILADNLRIYSDNKEVAIFSSDPEDMGSPLEVHLQHINLGSFDLIGDAPVIEGVFNGALVLSDIYTRFALTADLHIDTMGFRGTPIGEVQMLVAGPEPGLFHLEASIRGYGNRIDLSGNYRQDDGGLLDIELRLGNLELTSIEALTFNQLSGMEGSISGRLHISGPPANPDIIGAIHFKEASFHVGFLNVAYSIPEESVLFDKHHIQFDNFTLVDRSRREASLDGYIAWHDLSDIRFDLGLTSGNFLLMDLPRGANELFYGRLLIDTELAMHGDLESPVLEGRLKLNQGSDFAFILPQTMPEAIGDEGVVEFVSPYNDLFAELISRPVEPQPLMSVFSKLDVSVNVEIDPATDVLVLIDEVAGDYLELKGGGLLSYGIDPGGRISLAGRYEIVQGAYQMTFYDVIRRNFVIEAGSHIIWTGEPLDAIVDISAKYTVRTSVRELMATHAPDAGQLEGAYRQIYPFDVFLHMTGDLMEPEISFELSLPPEHRGAMNGRLQARLNELNQSESELNKQVFALLIIGNFIQDDPLAAVTAGPDISSTARNSASRILSHQLNRLSDRYIRGIDIHFEVESYEEIDDGRLTGRTELQMEVSRDFMDQRLRITAGGHLELEDETRRQLNPADIVGDFIVEYLVVPDGRLTLKGYRERKYHDVFDGEIIETGLSLIFRQTYDQFRDLFRSGDIRSLEDTRDENPKPQTPNSKP